MYEHFALRLKERYGMEITPLQYIHLCQAAFRFDCDCGEGRVKGWVEFMGQKVYVVKQKNRNKFLITATFKKRQKNEQ